MTLLIVGWSLTSIWCSTASTRKARSWRSTVCCEVHGTCRSIWNKFRFECCGQCSTKRKPLTKVRGFFVASATVSRQSRTVQDSNRAAARSAVSNQPSGLLLSPRFPIFRNVCQESTACRSTVCRTSVHAVPDRNNVRQSHS